MTQNEILPQSAPRKLPIAPYVCMLIFLVTLISGPMFILSLYTKSPAKQDVTMVIPRGSSVSEITKRLDAHELLLHPILFRISAKFMANNNLKAGEYLFPAGVNVIDLTRQLYKGQTISRQITFAEGLTSYEIVRKLKRDETFRGDIQGFPEEGTLHPETYQYSYGDSREMLLKRMQEEQKMLLDQLWGKRAPDLPFTSMREAIILASIVEKETGVKASERPLVASVFVNRLRKGMPLQSDPTVIYAMTKGAEKLGRPLLRKDLKIESPINTYQNAGLPPQPICNPGRASLEAVLNPAQTDFYYFVADGTGGHAFARTLKEHNKNVADWRKLRSKGDQ